MPSDLPSIRQLFYDTITSVNTKDYSPGEIKVWSSGYADTVRWANKLKQQDFYVYECEATIVAFASLLNRNYIDHLYVSQYHQGKGIATTLLQFIENKAKRANTSHIYSDVSITARSFFECHGYRVLKQNQIPHKGEVLINFNVVKKL